MENHLYSSQILGSILSIVTVILSFLPIYSQIVNLFVLVRFFLESNVRFAYRNSAHLSISHLVHLHNMPSSLRR